MGAHLYADPSDRARIVEALREQDEFRGLELEMLRYDGNGA